MLDPEEASNHSSSCSDNGETNLLVNMQNGTEPRDLNNEKLNGMPLDCPSSDRSSVSSRARGIQGGQSSRSGSISTVKDFLNSTFESPDLEQMYQKYFSKRKRTTVFFLLAFVILYNIVFLAISVVGYAKANSSNVPKELVPRICMSVIVIVILTVLFVLYCPRLLNLPSYSYLPGLLWFVVFLELIVDLLVSYMASKHIASYSVGLYIFFIYVTYSMIRFLKLYACIIFTVILTIFHAVAVAVMNDHDEYNKKLQIGANLMLMIAAWIIGIINYKVTDINQRRSFLDTRENVETSLAREKESKNQNRLLQSVLPAAVATQITEGIRQGEVLSDVLCNEGGFKKNLYIVSHPICSILFADIVGFTEYSSTVTAEKLIIMLNELFANFDKLAKRNKCQRIKILGDCYYCISGLDDKKDGDAPEGVNGSGAEKKKEEVPTDGDDINHAEDSVEMGLAVVEHIGKVRKNIKVNCLDMRVGIHSGHVLAGIIGQRKWQYDVWSNDVTLANKMESGGKPGRVHVSQDTYDYIKDSYEVEDGNGAERSGYLKEKNVTTYLIKERKTKFNERKRTATVKRNSTLKKQEEQAKKQDRGRSNRCDTSPFDKVISSAYGRGSARISIDNDNLPTVLEDGGTSTVATEYISIGAENTEDTEVKVADQQDIEINEQLKKALDGRNSDLNNLANLATLAFKDNESEQKYRAEKKQFCLLAFVTLHVCSLFSFLAELILKKSNAINIITFAVSFFVFSFFWVLTGIGRYSERLPKFVGDLSKRLHYSYSERTTVTTICVLLLLGAEVIDITCTSSPNDTLYYNPMFYSYNGVLILLVVCTLIQLPYVMRIALLLITTITYPLLFFLCIRNLYDQYDKNVFKGKPPPVWSLDTTILLTLQYIFYFGALFYHSYQSEKTARVLMLWKKEATESKDQVEILKSYNEKLMQNILPQHVIDHFLHVENKDETELYSKSYECVGVIFASIPNFSEFYSEDSINKDGMECMRVLNEIISDFDEVLKEERFNLIEKIKTVNSCYMAASGLDYNTSNSPNMAVTEPDKWKHLEQLTHFSIAIKTKLNDINAESFNNFALRVGIAEGPVVAGVIGAKKPHYDIWGNTVNIASRMESTGMAGTIQVLESTYNILKDRDFKFVKRGMVFVKGKGNLLTYTLESEEIFDYTNPRNQKQNKTNQQKEQKDLKNTTATHPPPQQLSQNKNKEDEDNPANNNGPNT